MSKAVLTKFLAKFFLVHTERRQPTYIEIEVWPPVLFHFIDASHSRVYRWQSGSMDDLRSLVVSELGQAGMVATVPCTSACKP